MGGVNLIQTVLIFGIIMFIFTRPPKGNGSNLMHYNLFLLRV